MCCLNLLNEYIHRKLVMSRKKFISYYLVEDGCGINYVNWLINVSFIITH